MELNCIYMTLSIKKSILGLASLAVVAAGCQIESMTDVPVVDATPLYSAVSESYAPMTKTAMDGLDVVWSEGDEVAVFQTNNRADRFCVTAESAGSTKAGFVLAEEISEGDPITSAVACYPYSPDLMLVENREMVEQGDDILMVLDGSYSLMGLDIPATQKYAAGSFANGAFPMVAVTNDLEDAFFEMKNVLGAIKLQITGDKSVKSITISGNAFEAIAGAAQSVIFSPDGDPVVLMGSDESSATAVTLDCGEGVELSSSAATDFVISLVPTVFESGFTVTLVDTDGISYQMEATAENEVQRSKVLVMPEIDLDDMTPILEVVTEADFTDVDIQMELLVEDAIGFYGVFAPKKIWEIYSSAFVDPSLVEGLFNGQFASDGLPCVEYFDTIYEGKLSHFGLDPYLVDDEYCNDVCPNSSYYLVIVPIFDDKDEYTLSDFILYEVQTLSLEKGGSVKLPNYTIKEGYFRSEVHFEPSKDINMVMYAVLNADDELPTEENYLDVVKETADYSSKDGFTINVVPAPGVLPGAAYKLCVVLGDSKNRTSFHTLDVNTKAIPYDETATVTVSAPTFTKAGAVFSAFVTYPEKAVKLYYVVEDHMLNEYGAAELMAGVLDGTSSAMTEVDLAGKANPFEISTKAKVNIARPVENVAHLFVLLENGKVSPFVTSETVTVSLR